MKFLCVPLLLSALAIALPQAETAPCVNTAPPRTITPSTGGTGPYKSHFFSDPTLPNHVVYQPKNPAGLKMPVIVWGNGQCFGDGAIFQAFLGQVASYGIVVLAGGKLGTGTNERVTAATMKQGIDWAVKVAGTGNYSHLDASQLAVWGQSCGGLLAIQNAGDERVTSVGIFNSGSSMIGGSAVSLRGLKKPVFYFVGGTCDMAYPSAESDFKVIPQGTPAWKGNLPVGHTATFPEVNAGRFGMAGVYLAQWLLRGNESASRWFVSGAKGEGWSVEHHDLDKIQVPAISK
ncbi:hypothetical protein B0T14DRAFT_498698 [Immersiella caudata]|uniref:Uncharacterized protein n=1 Tax=Immersiella caudata TaxID=314043 RepID=A0AA40BY01_9PEZI|nr:hypothetical protein B0T14DRAFT_498698 [Immersiella caudata]